MFLENSSINALLLKKEREKGMQVLLDANCCHLMSVKGMHLGLGKKKNPTHLKQLQVTLHQRMRLSLKNTSKLIFFHSITPS